MKRHDAKDSPVNSSFLLQSGCFLCSAVFLWPNFSGRYES